MIKKITLENFEEIAKPLNEMVNLLDQDDNEGSTPPDQFKEALKTDVFESFAVYDSSNIAIGFALIRVDQGRIALFYLSDHTEKDMLEIGLFNKIFKRLKMNNTTISSEEDFSDQLSDYLVEIGFEVLERSNIEITRDKIGELISPDLPNGYSFSSWDPEKIEKIAEMMSSLSQDTLDAEIYPFFKTKEGCHNFIKSIEDGKRGEFNKELSRILSYNEEPIGYCFITKSDDSTAFSPDFGVSKLYQGKGLGKALLIHTLIFVINNDSKIDRILGTVTQNNLPAFTLYEKLGFNEFEHGRAYVWHI